MVEASAARARDVAAHGMAVLMAEYMQQLEIGLSKIVTAAAGMKATADAISKMHDDASGSNASQEMVCVVDCLSCFVRALCVHVAFQYLFISIPDVDHRVV